jgi:ribose 5-phosphate isomerase A
MPGTDEIKKNAGVYAADLIENGMLIGLGTGSTVYWLIQELGKRVQQGLHVTVVPTSMQTQTLASSLNIPLTDLNNVDKLILTIDGADEVDPALNLIKGGGGALLQEKIVAAASEQLIIIVDDSKMVQQLGKFPLPVEVITFGYKQVQQRVISLGCKRVELRKKNNELFLTDHGHYILDCYFENIPDAESLNTTLRAIPGVVETGLFIKMATKIIVAYGSGKIDTIER